MKRIRNFLRNEAGMEFSEYAAATVLIVIAILTAFTNLSSTITVKINSLVTLITSK